MTDKSIDISEDLYNKLKHLKSKEESISDFILRLIKEKDKYVYQGFNSAAKEWERIEKILYEERLKNL